MPRSVRWAAYSSACGERLTAASSSKAAPGSLLFQFADEADHIETPLEMVAVEILHEYPEAVADVVAGRELGLRRRQPFAALIRFHFHVGISAAVEGLHHDAFVRQQHRVGDESAASGDARGGHTVVVTVLIGAAHYVDPVAITGDADIVERRRQRRDVLPGAECAVGADAAALDRREKRRAAQADQRKHVIAVRAPGQTVAAEGKRCG